MKKIKIEVTQAQLHAIQEITDDIDKMIGCSPNDYRWIKIVRLIDRMLEANGRSRKFKRSGA